MYVVRINIIRQSRNNLAEHKDLTEGKRFSMVHTLSTHEGNNICVQNFLWKIPWKENTWGSYVEGNIETFLGRIHLTISNSRSGLSPNDAGKRDLLNSCA
jgi:hypothetical protein